MQPDRNPTDWQQPKGQSSQAPYAANPLETPQQHDQVMPVVTLTPDQTQSVAPSVGQTNTTVANDQQPSQNSQIPEEPVELGDANQDVDDNGMAPVHWQAHEYIHHDKSPVWFILFAIVIVLLIVVAIFIIQSITFAVLIPVMAAALLVYTHRPPRILDYTLSRQGLHVNDHLYPFVDFKAFGVIHDGDEYSVMLVPTKRFRPSVSVYFPEDAGEAIVDMLGARLPMQELHLDSIDKLIRKLRI